MSFRKIIATVTLTSALALSSAAMAQMTNDTMGGTNRSGMESGQPRMQSGTMDDSRMATGTTRMKSKKMKSKKMMKSRMKRQMGNDTMNSSSGMSKTNGGRGGNMGGTSGM